MGKNAKIEDEKQSQNPVKQNNKKRKEIFPYGNYKNYYGYRVIFFSNPYIFCIIEFPNILIFSYLLCFLMYQIGHDVDEDPRLKVFRKEWFEGKDCLDIGCNNGMITIQIGNISPLFL